MKTYSWNSSVALLSPTCFSFLLRQMAIFVLAGIHIDLMITQQTHQSTLFYLLVFTDKIPLKICWVFYHEKIQNMFLSDKAKYM